MLVGLLVYGPALHYWYETMTALYPSNALPSALLKAALGQVLFAPPFNCLYLASTLVRTQTFTVRTWLRRIKAEVPGMCLTGMCYWPAVDVVCYTCLPTPRWIPLFVNGCSFLWTLYLSASTNRNGNGIGVGVTRGSGSAGEVDGAGKK